MQHLLGKRQQKNCKRSTLVGPSDKVTASGRTSALAYICGLISVYSGLTETSTVICSTPVHDVWTGSSGSLLPMVQAKIVSTEGKEIIAYGQPGELVVKSPSVVLGYLNNKKANEETFEDGWMRTGDEAVVAKAPSGNEHIFIVDRIKELIKVKVHHSHAWDIA